MHRAFERRENSFTQISNHIRKHIQTPAMGHAECDGFDSASGGAVDQSIEQGNDCFAAFE